MYGSLRNTRQSMLFHKPPNNNEIFTNNIIYNEQPGFNLNKRMIKKPQPVTQPSFNLNKRMIKKPQPVTQPVTQPKPVTDFSIRKIYIFSRIYTRFMAEALEHYFNQLNLEVKLFFTNLTNEIIDECSKDPNLYLFLICPQMILIKYKQDNRDELKELPKNKYILYQCEQYNQPHIPKLDIKLIENCYAIFDYSTINLQYYPDHLRENVKLLAPLIKEPQFEVFDSQELYVKKFVSNIINNVLKNYENELKIQENEINNEESNNEITILFIGLLNERREKILNELKNYNTLNNLNYVIKIINNVFGYELIELIKKSKIVINLHYYPNAILEIFRIHDLLPYDCKILSENPGNEEEIDLIEKYGNVVSFFPVINDDLSNIDKMYKLISDNLGNEIDLVERKKFIDDMNSGNKNCLKLKLNIKTYKIIVARYNENIEWTKNFNNVIIYNKGNKLVNFTNIIELDNVGREGHTYYKYIYDNYDSLPDYVIFLQGHPFDHSPNLYKNLNNIINKNNFKYFDWLSENIKKDDLNGNPNHLGLKVGEYYEKIFKINTSPQYFEFYAGAQFMVCKEAILSRTKDFYLNIIKTLDYNINPIEGYCLERLHKYIFIKKENCITIIVSRYNESVNWINSIINNNFIEKVIIFNKGLQNININHNKIQIHNVKNIGREGGTYLDYIINNYDNFQENLIFTQANPFEHNENFLEFLKDENIELYIHRNILSLTKQWKVFDNIPPQKFVKNNNSYNIENLELIKYFIKDYDHQIIGHSAFYDIKVKNKINSINKKYKTNNITHYLCNLLNIIPPKKIIIYLYCACFFLKSNQILKHQKDVYIKLRNFLYSSDMQGGREGYILERFWHYLFTGESYNNINECLKELFIDIDPIIKIYCDKEKKIVFKNINNSNNIIQNENKYLIYKKLNNDIKILPGIDLDGPEIKIMKCYNMNKAKYINI